MKRTFVIINLLAGFISVCGQTQLPKKVAEYIKNANLRPLKFVADTLPIDLHQNTLTVSGWHVDYYVSFARNLTFIHELIYNDSIFHTTSSESSSYRKMFVVKETTDFLYFSVLDLDSSDHLLILSKKFDHFRYEFSDLINKDFDNDIYLTYSLKRCKLGNTPHLEATNIRTNKSKEIRFSGYCDDYKNWCAETVTYLNGCLTIVVNVTNKKKKSKSKKSKL